MGKASKWFRGLLGLKKPETSTSTQPPKQPQTQKEKRRWSFVKSYREKDYTANSGSRDDLRHGGVDPDKHAIAVAAATAAVAEAAVAAAQAAAAAVRLTSSGRCATPGHASGSFAGARGAEELAALKIQSAFRGYLARRALRALKGLVKIQALVRGHIERKRTAERMRRMQALLRAQARARAERSQISESSQSSSKSSHFQHPGPATPEKVEQYVRVKSFKRDQSPVLQRNGSRSSSRSAVYQEREHLGRNQLEHRLIDAHRGPLMRNFPPSDENTDKILEVDTMKPLLTTKRSISVHPFHPTLASDQISYRTRSITATKDSTVHQTAPTPSSSEVQSLTPLKFPHEIEGQFCTADNSPQFFSASSKGGSSRRSPFTPSKSDGSRSFLSGYSDHPNYMAYTESSRAKVRSLSAPRQRPQFEKSSSVKRYYIYSYGDSRQKVSSSLQASFASKAYPGSGRLDRLGMPVIRGDGLGYR